VVCPYCKQTISSQFGMGGHMSKIHPGMSTKYKAMLEKREINTPKRDLHTMVTRALKATEPAEFLKMKNKFNCRRKTLKEQIVKANKAKGLDPFDLDNATTFLLEKNYIVKTHSSKN
jgi:hypothetical protein